MKIDELKKSLNESDMRLTTENIMDVFAFLNRGCSLEEYPDKEGLELVKKRFVELSTYKR